MSRLVVVGASLAGLRAAESARAAGFTGELLLVGAEPHLPYDRPPVSKALLGRDAGEHPPYRTFDELEALDVTLRLGAPATALGDHVVQVGPDQLEFDALVVATGARARPLPGEQLAGVHTLRTLDDALAVRAALDAGARTVVVGAGFIGSEVASAAAARGLPVTIVEASPQPLLRSVGPLAAALVTDLHSRAGVELRLAAPVDHLTAVGGHVNGVVLASGEELPAELVVVGTGAVPATEWLEGSALELDNGVLVGSTLAAAEGIWAAGDVAHVRGRGRVEHWTSANEQGGTAGHNAASWLAGEPAREHASVPYFWSELYGSRLQMVGTAEGADGVEVIGGSTGPWLVLYRCGDHFLGALSLDLPGRIMKFRKLLTAGASFDEALALARAKPLPPA